MDTENLQVWKMRQVCAEEGCDRPLSASQSIKEGICGVCDMKLHPHKIAYEGRTEKFKEGQRKADSTTNKLYP